MPLPHGLREAREGREAGGATDTARADARPEEQRSRSHRRLNTPLKQRRVGHQHAIFFEDLRRLDAADDADGEKDEGEDGGQGSAAPRAAHHRRAAQSRCLRAIRDLRRAQESAAPTGGGAGVGIDAPMISEFLQARAIFADTDTTAKAAKTLQSYEDQMASVENFILAVLSPGHPDYDIVKGWENGDTRWETPFSRDTLQLYLIHLCEEGPLKSAAGEDLLLPSHQGGARQPLIGRNLSGASVRQALKAITYFHNSRCRGEGGRVFPSTEHVGHPNIRNIVDAQVTPPPASPPFIAVGLG
jgi:hypothetical protein